jgi:hypothetical protein
MNAPEQPRGPKRAILIVGMHRSGTSCLAGSLQQRGLHLGDVQESSLHNRKGNRESLRIMHLNEALLVHGGGSWDRLPEEITWTGEHAAERDAIISMLESGSVTGCWGFKDPRTLATLPFWYDGIDGAVTLVGSFRAPTLVARSLHARGRMPYEAGYELWRIYNVLLLQQFQQRPFPLVCFDLDERPAEGGRPRSRAAPAGGVRRLADRADGPDRPGVRARRRRGQRRGAATCRWSADKRRPEPPPENVQLSPRFLKQMHVCPVGEDDAASTCWWPTRRTLPGRRRALATGREVRAVRRRALGDRRPDRALYGAGRRRWARSSRTSPRATGAARTTSSTCATSPPRRR